MPGRGQEKLFLPGGARYAGEMKNLCSAPGALMGLFVLGKAFRRMRRAAHAPKHVAKLALFGGFVDTIGGGGWGPVVTTTLVGSGHDPRTTIGSVNFAEFFVTLATAATFILTIGIAGWLPIAGLALGGAIASPLAARLTGRIPARPLMITVGVLVILLSVRTIVLAMG